MMMLLMIIFVHEMGHAVCAQYFKWRIKSIQSACHLVVTLETEEYGNKSLKEDMLVVLAGPSAAYLADWFQLYAVFLFLNFL